MNRGPFVQLRLYARRTTMPTILTTTALPSSGTAVHGATRSRHQADRWIEAERTGYPDPSDDMAKDPGCQHTQDPSRCGADYWSGFRSAFGESSTRKMPQRPWLTWLFKLPSR